MSAPLQPLHDLYFCERLKHPGKIGNIHLPDQSKEEFWDCTILGRGLGRFNRNGTVTATVGAPGDRLLCDPVGFEHFSDGPGEERQGFVALPYVLGLIRGPEFAQFEPMRDLVLVEPDVRDPEAKTEGGIIETYRSLPNGTARNKARGYELVVEYAGLLRSERYVEAPDDYERWRLERDFVEALDATDREEFRLARAHNVRLLLEQGIVGPVVLLNEKEYRAEAMMRLPPRIVTGIVRGLGPEVREEIPLDARVRWDFWHEETRLLLGGKLFLLIPEKDLLAVIGEDDDQLQAGRF